MPIHVAILLPPYLARILDGRKTVESRLYRTAMPPIGCAAVGERVYLKQSAGPFRAVARIARVDEHRDLTPQRVAALARRYNDAVCGDAAYWHDKRDSRLASFITLTDVRPIDVGPGYPKSMRAWHVLGEDADVVHDAPVTAGAIRNRYLRIGSAPGVRQWPETLRLSLPDGVTVDTDVTPRGMIRWRGWGRYYESHRVRPGDRVRLVALGGRRYRVEMLPHA